MGTYFGVTILVLLLLGLYQRYKSGKAWKKEEIREDSGEWIERRSGERGTYGSLDREREAERREIRHQSQINELALLFRTWFFERYPGYHALDKKTIDEHIIYCKSEAYVYINMIDQMLRGVIPEPADAPVAPGNQLFGEMILHYVYDSFPALLDMEIEDIKRLDAQTLALAARLEGYIAS